MSKVIDMSPAAQWLVKEAQKRPVKYILQGFGDLADPKYNGGYKAGLHEPLEFESFNAALWFLEQWATEVGVSQMDGIAYEFRELKLDPEDDRVTIIEVLSSGHKQVVWHFSGWHWDADEFGLEQGKFLGHEKSVYSETMEDY